MSKKSHLVSLTILIIAAFIFGRSTYIEYLAWYYGTNDLIFNETTPSLVSSLFNGLYFALSACIIYVLLIILKRLSLLSVSFPTFMCGISSYVVKFTLNYP